MAWTWRSVEEPVAKANHLKTWAWEATPLMVDGVLYVTTSLSQVAAIDAGTGRSALGLRPGNVEEWNAIEQWFRSPGRGLLGDGQDQRILFGTGDGYLISLNAKTGRPVESFGSKGRIDLTQGLGRPVERKLYGVSSPPVICRGVVVMGSKVNDVPLAGKMPPGDVRGFDVRTGKQLWSFHTIPIRGSLALTPGKRIPGRLPARRTFGP